jgi:hypothetical protein
VGDVQPGHSDSMFTNPDEQLGLWGRSKTPGADHPEQEVPFSMMSLEIIWKGIQAITLEVSNSEPSKRAHIRDGMFMAVSGFLDDE